MLAKTSASNGSLAGLKRGPPSADSPAFPMRKKIRRTFKKFEIEGDGNCLFRAFSKHFNGAEDEYEGVRLRIVNYVERNWEKFQPKVESVLSQRIARSARQYVSYMGKDKTFGSEVEILAASLLFKTPIRVYLKRAKRFLPIYESDLGMSNVSLAEDDETQNVLYLEYDEGNLHYNVLIPLDVQIVASGAVAGASSAQTTVSSTSPTLPPLAETDENPSSADEKWTTPPASSSSPETCGSSEHRATPKALFVNKTVANIRELEDPTSSAERSFTDSASYFSASSSKSPRPSFHSTSSSSSTRRASAPIVVRPCFVPLSRTPSLSSAPEISARGVAGVDGVSTTSPRLRLSPKWHRQRHVIPLCLASTRDPAFLGAITRAARRHLLEYEILRKRTVTNRITRMRSEGEVIDPDTRAELEAVTSKSARKEILVWPHFVHSLKCPDEIFLYHLLFLLFNAVQDIDDAFSVLTRHVLFLQRDEIEKYLTAYNLEFKSHDEETTQKILNHYRKSLKRDVAALRKEYRDTYFAYEELDHPCEPTNPRRRQNLVVVMLDSSQEEHRKLINRLSEFFLYAWKRRSLSSRDTAVSLAGLDDRVNAGLCNDYVDSIVHRFPTKNSIDREVRAFAHRVAVATGNDFRLHVYPKDEIFVDPSGCRGVFALKERLKVLAQQSVDLVTFKRQQSIGDRIEDIHLMESSQYQVALCLPLEDFVDFPTLLEMIFADLIFKMQTSNDQKGFLFLPAFQKNGPPFHPFAAGASLHRLAQESAYDLSVLTASRPHDEAVSIVLVQIEKVGLKTQKPEDELLSL